MESGIGFDRFATGHYARIVENNGRYLLKKPVVHQRIRPIFYIPVPTPVEPNPVPAGEYTKNEVREIARSLDLHTSERPESQDFISGGDYTHFSIKRI